MSGGGKSNGGGDRDGGVAHPIPASSRKMIQSVKEIVTNCPEQEIYTMLKDCKMDPDEAVQRLLSQDTFHEVKRKRERRKEIKESQQPRSRVVSSVSHCGSKVGSSEHNVQYGSSTQTNSSEHVNFAHETENGPLSSSGPAIVSSSSSWIAAANMNQKATSRSNLLDAGNEKWPTGTGDGICSSAQASARFQPACLESSGHVSMADIVRMGRPQGKDSCSGYTPVEISCLSQDAIGPDLSKHPAKHPHGIGSVQLESNKDLCSQAPSHGTSEVIHEPGITCWPVINDEWPVDASAASDAEFHSHLPNLNCDKANPSWNRHLDEAEVSRDVAVENHNIERTGVKSTSAFSRQMMANSAGFESHKHTSKLSKEHCASLGDVTAAVSSTTANLQQLSLRKEKLVDPDLEDKPAPLIPSHLQVSAVDFSHLNFGSYKPCIGSSSLKSLSSNAPKSDSMEASAVAGDGSSVAHLDNRLNTDARISDAPVSSLGELTEHASPVSTHEHQSVYEASIPRCNFETNQHWSSASYSQANTQFKDLPLCSATHAYSNSLPSHSLASNVYSFRESDPYSRLLATHWMHSRHNNAVLANSTATVSMPEIALLSQSCLQHSQDTNIRRGLAQHLTVPAYSQAVPLGQLTDIMGYPFKQENLTYAPAYHQSYPSDISWATAQNVGMQYTPPEYRSGASPCSSLPFTSNASGYRGYGSSSDPIQNFLQSPSALSTGNSLLNGNVLSSQYNGGTDGIPTQRNESFATWLRGTGSRAVSAFPASGLYDIGEQNQRHAIYRESQQPLQHHKVLGYPNFHHPESGIMQRESAARPYDLT